MKKAVKIIGLSILILVLFREMVFRKTIKYVEIGSRPEIEITNGKLIEKIERNSENKDFDLQEICELAADITKEELEFTTNRASNNPNELINTHQANCVGYSAMFNSIANFLIRKNKLTGEIEAKHRIGKLEIFGINLHQYFQSPFFKGHDFNEVTNKTTGERVFIDPSVSDYLLIKRVAKKQAEI